VLGDSEDDDRDHPEGGDHGRGEPRAQALLLHPGGNHAGRPFLTGARGIGHPGQFAIAGHSPAGGAA
jgi:hypothetical protein